MFPFVLAPQLSPNEKDISKLLDVDFYASKKRTVTASIFERLNSQVKPSSLEIFFSDTLTRKCFPRLRECIFLYIGTG